MGTFKYALIHNREEEMPYMLWLASTLDIGMRRYLKAQSFFKTPEELYKASSIEWKKTGVFTDKQIAKMDNNRKYRDWREEYERMAESGIQLLTVEDDNYPKKLLNIPSPPVFMFTKGHALNTDIPMVSVIGARECSIYGSKVATRLGELLGQSGIALVSGMARGIDSISQRAALKAGGYSVGVLGNGPDICYPPDSMDLYKMLVEKGAIISEYPPNTGGQPQFFACRNRIISGLSDVVCVVEAREKSGTMITVDAALEQGKEVYALPGRICDSTSRGCNELIRQGAGIITDLEEFVGNLTDMLTGIKVTLDEKETEQSEPCDLNMNPEEISFLRKVPEDSFTPDELLQDGLWSINEVMEKCLKLTMKGVFKNVGAGRFLVSDKGMKIRQSINR